MSYIERETALEFVLNNTPHINGETTMKCVARAIKEVPTADVVEVRHGEYHNTRFTDGVFYQEQCSICGEWTYEYDKKYCPHCGAKMDGGKTE